MVAVLLMALDVTYESIVEDYLLTNWCRRDVTLLDLSGSPFPEAMRPLFEARQEYLNATFATIEARYGSPKTYLSKHLGVGDELTDRLRSALLEVQVGA
jgi:protein-tyrosine phosphatase